MAPARGGLRSFQAPAQAVCPEVASLLPPCGKSCVPRGACSSTLVQHRAEPRAARAQASEHCPPWEGPGLGWARVCVQVRGGREVGVLAGAGLAGVRTAKGQRSRPGRPSCLRPTPASGAAVAEALTPEAGARAGAEAV